MTNFQNPNFDKSLYWERRKKHLTGQIRSAIVVQTIRDDDGEILEIIPVSGRRPVRNRHFYSHTSSKLSAPKKKDAIGAEVLEKLMEKNKGE